MTGTYRYDEKEEPKEEKEEPKEEKALGYIARELDTDKKMTDFIKKWLDYFNGGYGDKGVFVDGAHICAGKIPDVDVVAALEKVYIARAKPDGFLYPSLSYLDGSGVMTELLQKACEILKLTDENVRIYASKDYPVKLVGMDSGIEILIAPRIESGD